jgi:F0F1-type ATP synthase membrane subunit b/b'
MEHINPSHFVALSFFIFIAIVIRKRFFNVGVILDNEINAIKENIRIAEENRETASSQLNEMGLRLEGIDLKIAEILEKGKHTCATLVNSIRDEIASEIALKQSMHAVRAKQIEEQFQKIYQQQLIARILKELKNQLNTHTSSELRDSFYEQQLQQSLGLLKEIKSAA